MGTTVPVCRHDAAADPRRRGARPTVRAGGVGSRRPARRRGARRPCRSLCRSWLDSRTWVRQCRCAATTPVAAGYGSTSERADGQAVDVGGQRPVRRRGRRRSWWSPCRSWSSGSQIGALLLARRIPGTEGPSPSVPPFGQTGTQTRNGFTDLTGAARHPDGPAIGTAGARRVVSPRSSRPRTVPHPPTDCVPKRTAAAGRAAAVGSRPRMQHGAELSRVAGVNEQASYSQLDRSRAASRSTPVRAASRSSHWPR